MFASDEDFIDDAMYYLGKILENKGDITKAKSYYEKIVNQYSSSNQYKNAQNSLNQLSEQKFINNNFYYRVKTFMYLKQF